MEKKKIKREFSAGGIVFRKDPSTSSGQEETLWLVVKPTGSEKWRFPKGWIGKGESSLEAAKREVKEEAGIETEVLGKLGSEKFIFRWKKDLILKNVVFYLMEYVQETQGGYSWETEAIDWLPFKEARERLAFENDKKLLEKASGMLKEGLQPTLV